ncbi:hypothetical protein ACHAWF_017500 [Thalassiosira exigua]
MKSTPAPAPSSSSRRRTHSARPFASLLVALSLITSLAAATVPSLPMALLPRLRRAAFVGLRGGSNTDARRRSASCIAGAPLHRSIIEPPSSANLPSASLLSSTVRGRSDEASSRSAPRGGAPAEAERRPPASSTEEPAEPMSNYERLVRKLYLTNLYNPVKLGLENMGRLHAALGDPMDDPSVSVVHVAGSNGKGSVALKVAHTLQAAGYKVGLFVSPHISSFRERVQINGVPLTEGQVEEYLQEIYDICDREEIPATFFEVATALAFNAFKREKCDIVVLETGLGGRLDATNVIKSPALSIITSISLEHTRILGDTVEKIALEKGGIIKEGCDVLVGPNVPLEVMMQCADEKKASEVYTCEDLLGEDRSGAPEGDYSHVDYDVENSRIATAALILLQFQLATRALLEPGVEPKIIDPDQIAKGVEIRPPCRFEEMDVSKGRKIVRVVLDVAHNPQAIMCLASKLRSGYPTAPNVRIVVGMSSDKDLKACTLLLLDCVADPRKIHLVEASHPRAASVRSMLDANPMLVDSHYDAPGSDEVNEHGRDVSSVSTQVRKALEMAAKNDELLVVCGSIFIMADAREELGIEEPRDSKVISEVAGAGLRSSQENFGEVKR